MKGISSKKSILMLVTLFTLGACSTSGSINVDKYQFESSGITAVDDAILSTLKKFDIQTTGATQYEHIKPYDKYICVDFVFQEGNEFTYIYLVHECPSGEDAYVSYIYVVSWTTSPRDLSEYIISGITIENGEYYYNTTTLEQSYLFSTDTWEEKKDIPHYSYYKIADDKFYFEVGYILTYNNTGIFYSYRGIPYYTKM